MNCREFVEFLMAYVGRELSEPERAAFERHIADCPPCIHYLETYRETLELERQAYADEEALRAGAPESLVQAVLAARRSGGS